MDLFSHLLAGTMEGKSRGNEDCFHENSMGNYDGEWVRQREWALKGGHLTGWPWEGNHGDTGFHLRCKDLVQTTYKAGLYIQTQYLQQGDDAETSSPSSGSCHLLSFLQSCLDLSSMRQSQLCSDFHLGFLPQLTSWHQRGKQWLFLVPRHPPPMPSHDTSGFLPKALLEPSKALS